jgi:hypothetical protein
MPFDLGAMLPSLLPRAIAWAQAQAAAGAATGQALNGNSLAIARNVGVLHPEQIRISTVGAMPLPQDPHLRLAAAHVGFLGPGTEGLTLGYSIFVVRGSESLRLLSHEFRHVYQYEVKGGIAGFLPVYLQQIVDFGYINAPLEIDARDHEVLA